MSYFPFIHMQVAWEGWSDAEQELSPSPSLLATNITGSAGIDPLLPPKLWTHKAGAKPTASPDQCLLQDSAQTQREISACHPPGSQGCLHRWYLARGSPGACLQHPHVPKRWWGPRGDEDWGSRTPPMMSAPICRAGTAHVSPRAPVLPSDPHPDSLGAATSQGTGLGQDRPVSLPHVPSSPSGSAAGGGPGCFPPGSQGPVTDGCIRLEREQVTAGQPADSRGSLTRDREH